MTTTLVNPAVIASDLGPQWSAEPATEAMQQLGTGPNGLTAAEVQDRLHRFGLNEFEEEARDPLYKKILHHLRDIPTLILIAAAIIAAVSAILGARSYAGGTPSDWAKVILILIIVVINVVLGIYQEGRAEKALDALKKMNTFRSTVIRDGVPEIIDANQLVPGDLLVLTAGDVITADARLISASSLQVEEAALTGESVPVEKDPDLLIPADAPLGDRRNMVYSGCLVVGGRGQAVVTATAMNTEMGKIANLLNSTQKMLTPLQMRLKQLAKRISIIALISGFAMFLVGILVWGNSPLEMLLLAVALGVAAVPETLPIIVTMILSYGVYNMVTKRTIIRKIPAIETIGNTSVICSDKTGTLTQNKMKIQQFWEVGYDPIPAQEPFNKDQILMLELLASCSNATIEVTSDDEDERVVGDPTEVAIIRLLHDKGLTRVDAERALPRVYEIPFDSNRKLMTTVHHDEADGYIVVTKGAFDRIPVNWTAEQRERATEVHDGFADQALRVIAVAAKRVKHLPEEMTSETLESGLNFIGLVGMIDPPRPESAEAVARAKEAGIRTVMITGDHKGTAVAIAKEIGIFNPGDKALTGRDLDQMSEQDLFNQVKDVSVYARVSPEDKIRIVQAWLAHGDVITMTGDGVNDAPALKAADVGAAMGITGTEVSKNAADMVITDDNFATIVDAVAEGRTSFDNIRKIIQFLLGVNFAEIFVLLLGMLILGVPTITAMQILIINVVYDGIPGFFLAFEKPEPGVMKRKPVRKDTGIFANRVGFFIAARAVSFSILTLAAFIIGSYVHLSPRVGIPWDGTWSLEALRYGGNFAVGTTMAFMVLSWASTIDVFNTRTTLSIFKAGFLSNRGAFLAVLGAIAFSLIVALWPPLMAIFSVAPLSGWHWLIIAGLALMQVIAVEIMKAFLRWRDARTVLPTYGYATDTESQ
ncbi:MAG: cation-translocating P-type ATPase [Promicromonosporaceae bacterium]|nr:cation-translocating P-type ATPase [Promicromonosporaceae bacterium]